MFHIKKTENGNSRILHKGIVSAENGKSILKCIAEAEKRNKNKISLYAWQLNVNEDKIVYQLEKN